METIRMTKRCLGSHDGIHVRMYEAGEEHELGSELMPKDLARNFAEQGVIELVAEEQEEEKPAKAKKEPGPSEKK